MQMGTQPLHTYGCGAELDRILAAAEREVERIGSEP